MVKDGGEVAWVGNGGGGGKKTMVRGDYFPKL